MEKLKQQLKRHEGFRRYVYECPAGYMTVGIGRNLEGKGVSEKEALFLLDNDILECVDQLEQNSWWGDLDVVRKAVCINMVFNLGYFGFCRFKKMIEAIKRRDYVEASKQMLDSSWATQVGSRSTELSMQIKSGEWQF